MSLSLPFVTDYQVLVRMQHGDFEPFRLMVDGQELLVQQALRLLPGKRLVAYGVWGDQNVVVKLFYQPSKSKLHFSREYWGYTQAKQAQLNVAELLYSGSAEVMPKVFMMVYQQLYPVKLFGQFLQEAREEEVWERLQQLHEVLVQLYSHGLQQVDGHWDNFALVHDTVYALDYMSIRPCPGKRAEWRNLAALYAQLPLYYQQYLNDLLRYYCHYRGGVRDSILQVFVQTQMELSRWDKVQYVLNKCTRSTSRWSQYYKLPYWHICDEARVGPELQAFLKDPEVQFNESQQRIIKNGNTATLFYAVFDDQAVIVKRYNVKNAGHLLTHCWRSSRALKSWRNSCVLEEFAIPTAQPLAMVEKRVMGLTAQSYMVMSYIPGVTLDHYLNEYYDERVIEATIDLLECLAIMRISHGDLKAQNFIVHNHNVYLVDVDAMQLFRHNDKKWRKIFNKDLERFRKNWLSQPRLLATFDKLLATIRPVED